MELKALEAFKNRKIPPDDQNNERNVRKNEKFLPISALLISKELVQILEDFLATTHYYIAFLAYSFCLSIVCRKIFYKPLRLSKVPIFIENNAIRKLFEMVYDGAIERDSINNQDAVTHKGVAALLQDEIALRKKFFSSNILSGYCWDVLLKLLTITNEESDASITAMSTLGGMQASTGLRWIDVLSDEGLVMVAEDAGYSGRKFVTLTEKGKKDMESYLGEVAELRQLQMDGYLPDQASV